jgi:hypothetical protein
MNTNTGFVSKSVIFEQTLAVSRVKAPRNRLFQRSGSNI